jgi:uncharacterized protein (DUF1330 family)
MSNRNFMCADLAAVPSAKRSASRASFGAAAICAVMVCMAWATPAVARGGFMHGMGGLGMHGMGFGMHGGHGMGPGRREALLTPAYVLITVSAITDAEAFKVTINDLSAATAPFAGRLAADMDKPVAWEGTAAEHVVMIQFDNPDQAQAWKNSDAFKTFDAALHRSTQSSIQLVQGLPTAMANAEGGRGGRRNARLDPKAFEPNVTEYDQVLSKMHGICKGC